MRILIVDDEPAVRRICERVLTAAGHQVEACASCEAALPRLEEDWDLIVTDLAMPEGIDGNELLRRARRAGRADVAMMTADPTLDSSIAALKDGACDYLLKPFPLEALLDLAARRENGRRPPDAVAPRRLRTATILFADVRGFTSFSERSSPEEAAARLDELLAVFIAAVHAEGGTVSKFIGDGAMALFGVPLPHADPAGAAARAALRAREAVARLGALRFGFGINTGLVAAGSLGSGPRVQYDVIGSVVNIAARLEEAAGPGQILAGEETLALLDGRFALGAPRALRLEGLHAPVRAGELFGGDPVRPDGPAAALMDMMRDGS